MQLDFEMHSSAQFVSTDLRRKTFTQTGGVIGRGKNCDWIIPDRKRQVSSHHALISYSDGVFFLTDTSSNGTQDAVSGACLRKGETQRIEPGSIYVLGDFEIRARPNFGATSFDSEAGHSPTTGRIIPDEVFLDLDLDPLMASEMSHQEPAQRADFARIDLENMRIPELVEEPAAVTSATTPDTMEHRREDFWERFGAALGVNLEDLDRTAREALAVNAARLLKQSIGGLQQCLLTRSELKNELRLAQTIVQGAQANPLKFAVDAGGALGMLLANKPGQLPAEQVISRALRDLQAHQVALLAASRAAVRGALEHFSPQQLTRRFERDNKSLLVTSGSRWRAYGRYHQALLEDDDWSERLLARDFVQAYEEQVRLISTLHMDHQG